MSPSQRAEKTRLAQQAQIEEANQREEAAEARLEELKNN